MDVEITCPLGSVCEEIKDNKLHRCAWYTQISGTDSQGNEHNDWRCAIAWQPILQVEMSGTNRKQTAAIESMRNENTRRQDLAIEAMKNLEGSDGTKTINAQ